MKHDYRHLDDGPNDARLSVELPLRDVAHMVDRMNRGTHRFLSHLADVRRERLARRVASYRERGDHDVADFAEKAGDPIADALETLLEQL